VRILKESTRTHPRLSLILLDWGVRESFHLLHYLKDQTSSRDIFEVVLIEYYDAVSKPAKRFESDIDTWILLEMPANCYYHKHLMYNAGVVQSKGEILMFADSDAMVRPTFVQTVLQTFDRDPLIVYHMDEFRNVRRDFYPFSYPSFEDVLGDGCINNVDGKTKGVLDEIDPMHTKNYGACMCAWRKDVIGIGGADEDLTYLGHICGPYDMTFRLMNSGRRLVWETEEYLYHTWHPGSDGIANYLGPHDGRNMSTTAFQALCSGRVPPLAENEAIRRLRTGLPFSGSGLELRDLLIDPKYSAVFNRSKLSGAVNSKVAADGTPKEMVGSYKGFDVYRIDGSFYGVPQEIGPIDPDATEWRTHERVIQGCSFAAIHDFVDSGQTRFLETVRSFNICGVGNRFAVVPHEVGPVDFQVKRYRENPGIKWTETLREARLAAVEMSKPTSSKTGSVVDEAPAVAQQISALTDLYIGEVTRLQWNLTQLERRMFSAERGLTAIYHSHTWRTLVAVGGFFQATAKMLRRGR
jgi:hypothetical protein